MPMFIIQRPEHAMSFGKEHILHTALHPCDERFDAKMRAIGTLMLGA